MELHRVAVHGMNAADHPVEVPLGVEHQAYPPSVDPGAWFVDRPPLDLAWWAGRFRALTLPTLGLKAAVL